MTSWGVQACRRSGVQVVNANLQRSHITAVALALTTCTRQSARAEAPSEEKATQRQCLATWGWWRKRSWCQFVVRSVEEKWSAEFWGDVGFWLKLSLGLTLFSSVASG